MKFAQATPNSSAARPLEMASAHSHAARHVADGTLPQNSVTSTPRRPRQDEGTVGGRSR